MGSQMKSGTDMVEDIIKYGFNKKCMSLAGSVCYCT